MKFDVVGFGALNLDILCKVKTLARRGEHTPIIEIHRSPGGSAANTISGLARLGLKTGFIGAVGNDLEGEFILNEFKRDGVDTGCIEILDANTGLVIGFVDETGERTLYPYPGTNDIIEFKNEYLRYLKNAKYLHMSSFIGERQLEIQKILVKKSDKSKTKISFCPSDLYAKKGIDELIDIIERTEIIFLNKSEIEELTNMNYRDGSLALIDSGVRIVVVTLGKDGCYVRYLDDEIRVKSFPANVIDTTGAGDAFNAGFLYGVLKNMSIKESAIMGNWIAARCIEKFGARYGLPKKIDAEEILRNYS
ncbi:MAG: sugar kinase [Candidatus Altiarchaeales archaeon]|nr:MAG: sugar kinase [Candidatus Altiarchaeales archaeon]RLI95131.1 MAG: sugar kinase [Candidatus Altiarchaeales archaeon]HDO82864.1 carbohydrate kinase family protein [Candidatus Altiarchaeales archaeon]HEX55513.1 carbohydrate kinase family protein [Candidatus Altiarchaeales archaeon]